MSKEPKTRVGPSFHKGDVVRHNGVIVVGVASFCWRESTAAENAAWYWAISAEFDHGLNTHGEVPLPPRYQTFEIKNGTIGLVTRGRVARTSSGWVIKRDLCEVFWPDLGETLIVPKSRLELAW